MNAKKTYTSIAELLAEESFLAWYLKKNALHEQAWEQWMAAQPGRAALVNEAEQVLEVLVNLEREPISNYQRNTSFNRLLKKIADKEKKLLTANGTIAVNR